MNITNDDSGRKPRESTNIGTNISGDQGSAVVRKRSGSREYSKTRGST
jgi:hypothetical protein